MYVAVCVFGEGGAEVWGKGAEVWTRVLNAPSSPALKHLSLAQNMFVLAQKVFISSTMNAFVYYLEGGLENPRKRTKTKGKSFCKTLVQLRMDRKKDRNKAEMKRHKKPIYPTFAVHICKRQVVFLHSFISALFLSYFQFHPYLKGSFTQTKFITIL